MGATISVSASSGAKCSGSPPTRRGSRTLSDLLAVKFMGGYVFNRVIEALRCHVCRSPRLTPNDRLQFFSSYDAFPTVHSKRMKREFDERIPQMLLMKTISEQARKSFSKSPDSARIHNRGDGV